MSTESVQFAEKVREAWERMRQRNLAQIQRVANERQKGHLSMGNCPNCGQLVHMDAWREMGRDGIEREHVRCHECNTVTVY